MLKILFVLHLPPPVHGSAVVGGFIRNNSLISSSFDCRFINLGTSESLNDIGRYNFRKFFRYLSLIFQSKKQLLIFRPHLCYFTPTARGIGFYKDALIISIFKIFGFRTVFHFHNKGVSRNQGRFFDNLLYRFIFHNSNVILLSQYLYPDIQKYVPQSRVFYCPNGIPGLEDERLKEKDKSSGYVPEILFLSHLNKSKGVLVLIETCALLKEKELNFHCTIAGGADELTPEQVEEVINERSLETFISVVGPKYGEEKIKLLKASNIFVYPSYNDCLPLILLEAMQFSLPIVSTCEGAIPDAVDDGISGFLVPQKNPYILSEKLAVLIRDPELRVNMGMAGLAKYKRDFTLERFEEKIVEILKEVGSI